MRSIIGDEVLNCQVRNGTGCAHLSMDASKFLAEPLLFGCVKLCFYCGHVCLNTLPCKSLAFLAKELNLQQETSQSNIHLSNSGPFGARFAYIRPLGGRWKRLKYIGKLRFP